MMERHEVEAFLTLADELHFGRTAERLRVTTTRVSQTIRKLERRVGAPLFLRTSRRVELSPIGRQLREEVQPAWDRLGAAMEAAIEAGRGVTGTLRVAFIGAMAAQVLVRSAASFAERMSGATVQLREAQIAQAWPWLHEGKIDVLCANIPVQDDNFVDGPVLFEEDRMLAIAAAHPFAARDSVSMDELLDTAFIHVADTSELGAGPSARTFHEILALVGAGQGAFTIGALTRRYYPHPDVAYVPINNAPPIRWGLIWRTDAPSALIDAFSEVAEQVAAQWEW